VRRVCRVPMSNPPLGIAFTAVLYEYEFSSILENTLAFKFRAVNVLQKKKIFSRFLCCETTEVWE
jgi:hypothetical protein